MQLNKNIALEEKCDFVVGAFTRENEVENLNLSKIQTVNQKLSKQLSSSVSISAIGSPTFITSSEATRLTISPA